MAEYCRTIFGDALLIEPLEKYPVRLIVRHAPFNTHLYHYFKVSLKSNVSDASREIRFFILNDLTGILKTYCIRAMWLICADCRSTQD